MTTFAALLLALTTATAPPLDALMRQGEMYAALGFHEQAVEAYEARSPS